MALPPPRYSASGDNTAGQAAQNSRHYVANTSAGIYRFLALEESVWWYAMKNLWAVISRTWRALTAIAGIIGVLFLWQDLQYLPKAMGLPDAYSWAWRWLLELERETVAFLLLGLALAWILWIDARPLVWRWLENRKPQQIIISDTPYCESYILKPSPDEKAQFYTNVFYLPVGNGLDTGQTLKRVQVRIFHVGPPTLCRIKDTEAEEVDIRHGEWAYFEIGQVVSKEMMGLIFGTRIGNGGRLEAYPRIGALTQIDAVAAIENPTKSEGADIEEAAIYEILSLTERYPYFLQQWGYESWNVSNNDLITVQDVRDATPLAIAALDESFFKVRFDRCTPAEKRYMRALAGLGAGQHRSGDVAEILDVKVNSVAPTRSNLIKKGMIYSPSHGDTAFTVPMFHDFMKRAMPSIE
jgi:hypothetical protein